MFLLCPSRWSIRAALALVCATATSLRSARLLLSDHLSGALAPSPHAAWWYLALTCAAAAAAPLGALLSLSPWHGVSWLNDKFKQDWVEDRGDVWVGGKRSSGVPLLSTEAAGEDSSSVSSCDTVEEKGKGHDIAANSKKTRSCPTVPCAVRFACRVIVFGSCVAAFAFHLVAIVWRSTWREAFNQSDSSDVEEKVGRTLFDLDADEVSEIEFWCGVASFISCQLLNLGAMVYLVAQTFTVGGQSAD